MLNTIQILIWYFIISNKISFFILNTYIVYDIGGEIYVPSKCSQNIFTLVSWDVCSDKHYDQGKSWLLNLQSDTDKHCSQRWCHFTTQPVANKPKDDTLVVWHFIFCKWLQVGKSGKVTSKKCPVWTWESWFTNNWKVKWGQLDITI